MYLILISTPDQFMQQMSFLTDRRCRVNWGVPEPLWKLIFSYCDLIIILKFYILFTADRKDTAVWLVGNSTMKHNNIYIWSFSRVGQN